MQIRSANPLPDQIATSLSYGWQASPHHVDVFWPSKTPASILVIWRMSSGGVGHLFARKGLFVPQVFRSLGHRPPLLRLACALGMITMHIGSSQICQQTPQKCLSGDQTKLRPPFAFLRYGCSGRGFLQGHITGDALKNKSAIVGCMWVCAW